MQGETGQLVVITGPSGVGKSTIVRQVLDRTGAVYSTSATTRPPRSGETDKEDYYFTDRPTFEGMIENGELLEWAEVFGNYYGTPAGPVLEAIEAGRTVILEIDVQGGIQVARKQPGATFVLITAPVETIEQRLRKRDTEDEQTLQRRLNEAQKELRQAAESGIYTHTVVNDDLETAIREVVSIVQE